jgi:hypothetical protein
LASRRSDPAFCSCYSSQPASTFERVWVTIEHYTAELVHDPSDLPQLSGRAKTLHAEDRQPAAMATACRTVEIALPFAPDLSPPHAPRAEAALRELTSE